MYVTFKILNRAFYFLPILFAKHSFTRTFIKNKAQ